MSDKAIMVAAGGLVVGGLLIFWAVQPPAPIMPEGPIVVAGAPVRNPDDISPPQNAVAPAPAPAPFVPTSTAPAPQSQSAKIDTAESNASGESKYNKPTQPDDRLTYEDERYGTGNADRGEQNPDAAPATETTSSSEDRNRND